MTILRAAILSSTLLLGIAFEARAATCTTAVSIEALRLDLERVEAAYKAEDADAVRQIADTITADLPCLGEAVHPAVAAAIHRALGLRAFLDRRNPEAKPARLYFAAARNAEPNYTFPPDVVGPDDPVYREYVAVPVGAGRVDEVVPQTPRKTYFDGTPTTRRPAEWPTIYQLLDERDRALATAYLMPGDSIPGVATAPAKAAASVTETRPRERDSSPGAWIAGGASLAMLGAGVGMHVYNLSVYQAGLNACATGNGLVPEYDPEACPSEEQNFSTWRTSYIADIAMMIAGGAGLATTGAIVLLDGDGVTVVVQGHF